MNNKIQKIIDEFDNLFGNRSGGFVGQIEISKQFLIQSLNSYAEEIIKEIDDELPAYWEAGIERTYEAGWDDCLSKVKEILDNFIVVANGIRKTKRYR